jgi:release factor glutamine methyltransferase
MFVIMTIHEASQQLRFRLFHLYDEREAGNITGLVMEHITGWKRIDRVVNKMVPLLAGQQQLLETYTKALLDNKPLQYVLHEAWFYNMLLYVDENVLIPRPETEELVDWLIKEVQSLAFAVPGSQPAAKNIFDIGTGSGCIPLAIKKTLPFIEMYACDVSEAALHVAKKNAADQKLAVHFQLLDILSEEDRRPLPRFDIIISNPPYIPQKDKTGMSPNVLQYEPHLALFVEDTNPLLFYKVVAAFAKDHLTENGLIYLEIHEGMAAAVSDLYRQNGFSGIVLKKDLQGRDRMIKISV